MFRSKKTEQFNLIQHEREMERELTRMLDGDLDIDLARILFLEQFTGEEQFFDEFVEEYLR